MRFDDLDAIMRPFETAHDHCVLPGIHMVARLDGRGFTRLTKERMDFERPFDERFRDCMVETTAHLMECGFRVSYGYTESDEISLLFHRDEDTFGRKLRKFNSVLAGEASAKFTLLVDHVACFDCRISQLPTTSKVVDYFRWRASDAQRNALSAHCYWMLRGQGQSKGQATARLAGLSTDSKHDLLMESGVNFHDLPAWQKRGVGLYWKAYEKEGHNPKTGQAVLTTRRGLHTEYELPMKEEYRCFVKQRIRESQQG